MKTALLLVVLAGGLVGCAQDDYSEPRRVWIDPSISSQAVMSGIKAWEKVCIFARLETDQSKAHVRVVPDAANDCTADASGITWVGSAGFDDIIHLRTACYPDGVGIPRLAAHEFGHILLGPEHIPPERPAVMNAIFGNEDPVLTDADLGYYWGIATAQPPCTTR